MKSMKSLNLFPTESSNITAKNNKSKTNNLYPSQFLFKYSKFTTNRIIFNGNIKKKNYPFLKRNQYNHTLLLRNFFESKEKIGNTFDENKHNNKYLLTKEKKCLLCKNYFFEKVLPIFFTNYKKIFERNELISGKMIVDSILYNFRSRIVALFKDYLIFDDRYEFFEKFYTIEESKNKLNKLIINENKKKYIPKFIQLKFWSLLWEINKKKNKRNEQKNGQFFSNGKYSIFLNSEFRCNLEKDINEMNNNLNSEIEELKLLDNFSNISSLNFSNTSIIPPNNFFELKKANPKPTQVLVNNLSKPNIMKNLKQINKINAQNHQVSVKKFIASKINLHPISSRNNEIINQNHAFRIKLFGTTRYSNSNNNNREKEIAKFKSIEK